MIAAMPAKRLPLATAPDCLPDVSAAGGNSSGLLAARLSNGLPKDMLPAAAFLSRCPFCGNGCPKAAKRQVVCRYSLRSLYTGL